MLFREGDRQADRLTYKQTGRQTNRQAERERYITITLTTSGRSSPRLVFLQEKLSSPTTITTIGLPKVSLAYLKMSVQDLSFAQLVEMNTTKMVESIRALAIRSVEYWLLSSGNQLFVHEYKVTFHLIQCTSTRYTRCRCEVEFSKFYMQSYNFIVLKPLMDKKITVKYLPNKNIQGIKHKVIKK